MTTNRQIALICAGAVAAGLVLWFGQPKTADLSPLDFAVGGTNALEFCDPRNPRFLPVANRPTPVIFKQLEPGLFSLRTVLRKPIGAMNLVDRQLRFFAVDADAAHFAVADAHPGGEDGQWRCAVPPGMTRVFADFTPAATGREMYAEAPLPYGGAWDGAAAPAAGAADLTLTPEPTIAARTPTDVGLKSSGRIVAAELAVFDRQPSGPTGFMSHPADLIVKTPDGTQAHFQFTFTDPGKYVLWAHVRVDGADQQVRTEVTVVP